MWHWDQGRLAYFQFDALRAIAQFVQLHDFKSAPRPLVAAGTGLAFQAPATHSPWRNYSRVLKLCLLVSEQFGVAAPTAVSALLARPGAVVSQEYFEFLIQASTEPNPALETWRPTADFRYPLLFAAKYLFAKGIREPGFPATMDEIIGAYSISSFIGHEGLAQYLGLMGRARFYDNHGSQSAANLRRQARESLKVICQLPYLRLQDSEISVSLSPDECERRFSALIPVTGPRAADRDAEIRRLADIFAGRTTATVIPLSGSVLDDVADSGFLEGGKVRKSHVIIERNSGLRKAYFAENPGSVCDVCDIDTHATYPWTERVMDLHHLLPLSSGARVLASGTTFEDLVPVCPTCHRAIHRFYDGWFAAETKADFASRDEAMAVYDKVKISFTGHIYG